MEAAKLWQYVTSNNCILSAKSVSQYKFHTEKVKVFIALGGETAYLNHNQEVYHACTPLQSPFPTCIKTSIWETQHGKIRVTFLYTVNNA